MIGIQYATAIGRIRVKERFLFGRSDLLRLAEAKNGEEAMQILSKTNYAKYITKLDGGRNYQEIIDGNTNIKNGDVIAVMPPFAGG